MKVVLKDIVKRFPNRNKKIGGELTVVDHFNFEIPDGTLVGLLGPSGCGKSTTLNMICGLLEPTEGQIFFGDEDVTMLPPEKRGVGLVFQNYALYPHLTVMQNICFPMENLKGSEKMSKEAMQQRALEVAKLVQIEELMDRKPSQLSGGQQQRVAIARALAKMPRVLLLDEPLSNLDARLRIQTREEIKRIQVKTGITTVFVTHDQDEAMSISDLIIVMSDGHVQQIGKPQDIYDDPDNLFVAKFLGVPPINVFTDVKDGKDVYVAIRPEGLIPDPNGELELAYKGIEAMGRESILTAKAENCISGYVHAVIPSDLKLDVSEDKTIKFSIKPNKIFYFDKETEARIR